MNTNWYDIKEFLLKLNLVKIVNSIKVTFSYLISTLFKQVVVWGYPSSLSIEPTNFCNLRCPLCATGSGLLTRKKCFISKELFEKTVQEMHKTTFFLQFYFQGEPLLHNQILSMIRFAANKKLYTILSTNANTIDQTMALGIVKSGLSRIIISLDASSPENYAKYRVNGNFGSVIQSINNIITAKSIVKSKKPFIELQFLIHKYNEKEITDAQLLRKELNADSLTLKTIQLLDTNDMATAINYLPNSSKYSRYYFSNKTAQIKNKLKNKCSKLWYSSVISCEGSVLPCCFDKDAHYKLGNVSDTAFYKIWKSASYNNFRKNVLKKRKAIDICQNCTSGLQIKKFEKKIRNQN